MGARAHRPNGHDSCDDVGVWGRIARIVASRPKTLQAPSYMYITAGTSPPAPTTAPRPDGGVDVGAGRTPVVPSPLVALLALYRKFGAIYKSSELEASYFFCAGPPVCAILRFFAGFFFAGRL